MSSIASSLKRKKITSSNPYAKVDSSKLGVDMVHALSYLAAVSAAGIPRGQLFELAANLQNATAPYFRQVQTIVRTMNYQYAEACRVVGESAKDEHVKSLFLRLAGAMYSGEPEMDFLAREAQVQADVYGNEYEGQLETLKKWTDAYAALVVSAVLIVVVATVSTLIYDLGAPMVLGLVATTIGMTAMGAWVLYASAPKETKPLQGKDGKESQRLPRRLMAIFLPMAAVWGLGGWALGVPSGVLLLGIAAAIFPVGVVGLRYDARMDKHELDFNTFLRMLGSTASATGITPAEAISRLDLRAAPSLIEKIKNLRLRLQSRAQPIMCWRRFVVECGSDLIDRTVMTFMDGVRLGGDPEEVTSRASLLAMKITYLRAKRKLVTSTFGWLSIAMHASTIFLLAFVVQIVSGFGSLVQHATNATSAADLSAGSLGTSTVVPSAFSFSFANLALLQGLLLPVVILLSLLNAAAPYLADGGYYPKFFVFLSGTLAASGVALIIAPLLTNAIYKAAGTV